jgi:hypothetical protein
MSVWDILIQLPRGFSEGALCHLAAFGDYLVCWPRSGRDARSCRVTLPERNWLSLSRSFFCLGIGSFVGLFVLAPLSRPSYVRSS